MENKYKHRKVNFHSLLNMVLFGWLLCGLTLYRSFVYMVVLRAPLSVWDPCLLQRASKNELQYVFFMVNCWKYLFFKSHKLNCCPDSQGPENVGGK